MHFCIPGVKFVLCMPTINFPVVFKAKMFADEFVERHKSSEQFDLDKLSKERIAAINFFTHETPFYGALNTTLRSTNRADAKPFFAWYLYYILDAYA